MTQRISRREGLLAGLFGTGYIGLRALATGLPTWYLMNPRRATALQGIDQHVALDAGMPVDCAQQIRAQRLHLLMDDVCELPLDVLARLSDLQTDLVQDACLLLQPEQFIV